MGSCFVFIKVTKKNSLMTRSLIFIKGVRHSRAIWKSPILKQSHGEVAHSNVTQTNIRKQVYRDVTRN